MNELIDELRNLLTIAWEMGNTPVTIGNFDFRLLTIAFEIPLFVFGVFVLFTWLYKD